jgi:hypothetical protein
MLCTRWGPLGRQREEGKDSVRWQWRQGPSAQPGRLASEQMGEEKESLLVRVPVRRVGTGDG